MTKSDRIATLERENAILQKDAARWNWVRNIGDKTFRAFASSTDPKIIDKYIDAALQPKEPTK